MWKILQYYVFLLIILATSSQVMAQKGKRIKYETDKETGYSQYVNKDGTSYTLLVNGVVFTQAETTVYCDSSVFYKKTNTMEAYDNVRIVDGPTTITSNKLTYEGDARMARLRENVIYNEGERKLYTDYLDYDLDGEIANYFNKGKLIDSTNVLTSKIGYYFAKDNYAQFYTNVVLVAPDFTLKTDTLKYNTITKVAYSYGPTEIIDKDEGTTLYAQGGEFRTEIDESDFIEGQIETDDYYLEGDELYFDDLKKYYKAVSNVKMTAKNDDIIITGDEGFYDRRNGISKVYGNPLMKRILEADTFYLAADTLVAIESDYDSLKRILAYHDIKVYKEGLQGIADSMAYFMQDSVLFFYHDPVMWNNQNQITADTINLEISEDEMRKMNLLTNSFLISEDSIGNYNQIKGRDMEAYFVENQIDKIDVNGNGEVLYFALEEGDSVLMGMNKVFCASMRIRFEDQKLTSFSVYTNPEAQFIPPHELTQEARRLTNFAWREDERPALYDVAPYLNPDYDPSKVEADSTEKPKAENQSVGKPRLSQPARNQINNQGVRTEQTKKDSNQTTLPKGTNRKPLKNRGGLKRDDGIPL